MENYKTIKNAGLEKGVENTPLAICSAILDILSKLDLELARFQKSSDGLFNIEELPSSSKLHYDAVKIMLAAGFLNCLLYTSKTPRPPTYDEIAEASGVGRHKAERILRGECSSLKAFYSVNQIHMFSHTELGLKRTNLYGKKSKKVFIRKRAGRPPQLKQLKGSMGRPSKFIVMFPKIPLAELYNSLREEDKNRLQDYMSSNLMCDATRGFLMKLCCLLSHFFQADEASFKNFIKKIIVDVVKRSVEIAERNCASIPNEIKEACKDENFEGNWAQLKSCLDLNKMQTYTNALSNSELQDLIMRCFKGFN